MFMSFFSCAFLYSDHFSFSDMILYIIIIYVICIDIVYVCFQKNDVDTLCASSRSFHDISDPPL